MRTDKQNENTEHETQAKFEDTRARLIRDFDISSSFVKVPTLAKVLGVTPATVYAAMREKRFFLPHRLVCSSPAVKLDDLAQWFCDTENETPAVDAEGPKPRGRGVAAQRKWAASRGVEQPRAGTTEDELVAKVLARMAREDAERKSAR